ncbi:hypothetical protein NMG60_11031942 [Bertholletia excelsa]
MSHHSGASRKRKEMEGQPLCAATPSARSKPAEPLSRDRLLAGYMAHEFLAKGTLFGQPLDSARPNGSAEPRKSMPAQNRSLEAEPGGKVKQQHEHLHGRSYAEVAILLKEDGAHVPGILNPTQLARWIKM